jgi:transcriptional regulator with XRE-family HTH domain
MGNDKSYYKPLGYRLRRLRQKRQESLAEVSGAVEIDEEELTRIEQGKTCPSEDVLLLLISHLNAREDEANQLWELAGYDQDGFAAGSTPGDSENQTKSMAMVMPMDARIVYTDMIHVIVNDYGVVMNFMQRSGLGNQPLAVSRIGMSRDHAESVIKIIRQALDQADSTPQTKALPPPRSDNQPPTANGV